MKLIHYIVLEVAAVIGCLAAYGVSLYHAIVNYTALGLDVFKMWQFWVFSGGGVIVSAISAVVFMWFLLEDIRKRQKEGD